MLLTLLVVSTKGTRRWGAEGKYDLEVVCEDQAEVGVGLAGLTDNTKTAEQERARTSFVKAGGLTLVLKQLKSMCEQASSSRRYAHIFDCLSAAICALTISTELEPFFSDDGVYIKTFSELAREGPRDISCEAFKCLSLLAEFSFPNRSLRRILFENLCFERILERVASFATGDICMIASLGVVRYGLETLVEMNAWGTTAPVGTGTGLPAPNGSTDQLVSVLRVLVPLLEPSRGQSSHSIAFVLESLRIASHIPGLASFMLAEMDVHTHLVRVAHDLQRVDRCTKCVSRAIYSRLCAEVLRVWSCSECLWRR
jgi:hypothetical protein